MNARDPESGGYEPQPTVDIEEYIEQALADQESSVRSGLAGVSDDALHALEPRYPSGEYDRPFDLGEKRDKQRLIGSLVLKALDYIENKRVQNRSEFTTRIKRASLDDYGVDLTVDICQMELEGSLIIDGTVVPFTPNKKLIAITAKNNGAHNGATQYGDSITYYYTPFNKRLTSTFAKVNPGSEAPLNIFSISPKKSDEENVQALLTSYPATAFRQ